MGAYGSTWEYIGEGAIMARLVVNTWCRVAGWTPPYTLMHLHYSSTRATKIKFKGN